MERRCISRLLPGPMLPLQPLVSSRQQKLENWQPWNWRNIHGKSIITRIQTICADKQHSLCVAPKSASRAASGLLRRSSKDSEAKRPLANSVAKEGGPTSRDTPDSEELQKQLEALHDEALRVRNRYNSAGARFMRLTEVAQQLRQRAALDMKLGNEDSARKVLKEKQKVMKAAELSKKRAHLLEELSTKLGEAISRKETQLIVALSNLRLKLSPDDESTVRVIFPKQEPLFSTPLGPETEEDPEEDPDDAGIAKSPPTVLDIPDLDDTSSVVSPEIESVEVDAPNTTSLGEEFRVEDNVDTADRQGFPIPGVLFVEEDRVEMAGTEAGSVTVDVVFGRKDFVQDRSDRVLQSGGTLLFEDYVQGESSTPGRTGGREGSSSSAVVAGASDLNNNKSLKGVSGERLDVEEAIRDDDDDLVIASASVESERIKTVSWDLDPDNEDLIPGREDEMEAGRKASICDGGIQSFEDFIRDVDHQVATVESKLQLLMETEVKKNKNLGNERLRLVEELLEQVQSIRARITETQELM